MTLISFKPKQKIINRKKCILCNRTKLAEVLSFGKTPLANSYPLNNKIKEDYYKLDILLCKSCGHLQLKQLINPNLLFQNYLYVSGTSKVLKKHFFQYTNKIIKKFNLNKSDKILDIACNDGTLLNFFVKKKFKSVIGVEPAKNLRKLNLKKKIDINTLFFNKSTSYLLKKKYQNFKIITANNVCAHTPNLNSFFQGVHNILDKKGIFILEVSYLKDVIKKMTFDTFYHEHMSYHTLTPLIKFCKNNNLEIFDFEKVSAQGGSIRIYISHTGIFPIKKKKIFKQITKEKNLGLFKNSTYKIYYNKILKQKLVLKKILDNAKLNKKKVVGYGAPAKLTTFSHVLNIDSNDINYIIDDNPLKQNRYSPGKKIKIFNIRALKKNSPDIILVLAWNFYNSIKKKCLRFLNKKIKFIKPFPKAILD